MNKILVTGGTGFIGSHLCKKLIEKKYKVFALTRQGTIDEKFRLWGYADKLTLLEGDMRNYEDISYLSDFHFDIIYNLAAYNRVGKSYQRITEVFEVNTIGVANLLKTAKNCKLFIHVSSSEVYGNASIFPISENLDCFPISPYSVSKVSGEELIKIICAERDIPYYIVRPFNTYGPYQSSRAIISELILCGLNKKPFILRAGSHTRDFVYVDDTVKGLMSILDCKKGFSEPINLATGREISMIDLATLIKEIMKLNSQIILNGKEKRPNDIQRLCGTYALAKDQLNWNPSITLEEGLNLTISWMSNWFNKDHKI